MPKSSSDTTHMRKHVVQLDHKELEKAIAMVAADCVEHYTPNFKAPGVSYKVEIEEATEGSPAYRVGFKATVTIIEDLQPQAEEAK